MQQPSQQNVNLAGNLKVEITEEPFDCEVEE
jgi:hypothetical protein